MHIIFHADDFGITRQQSERILCCSTVCGGKGVLNSTSILVNSPAFSECATLIQPHVESQSIQLGWHVNLLEGSCCAPSQNIPLLVNASGLFDKSFTQLLKLSKSTQKKSGYWLQIMTRTGRKPAKKQQSRQQRPRTRTRAGSTKFILSTCITGQRTQTRYSS